MRRRLLILAAILIGGVGINTGVAWWFACQSDASDFDIPLETVNRQYADRSLLHGMVYRKSNGSAYYALAYMPGRYTPMGWNDDVPAFVRRQPTYVQDVFHRWWGEGEQPAAVSSYIAVIARGWPWPSLYSYEEVELFQPDAGPRGAYRDHGGIVIAALNRPNTGQAPFHAIVLPLRPVWPAFAFNSLLFAGMLAIPVYVVFGVRSASRRRRMRRGICPRCGYDLRSNYENGCSECGWRRST